MNLTRRWFLCAVSAAVISLPAFSATLASPPKVVKAVPDNGDQNVDPAVRQIRIVFDQAMEPGGCSVVGGGETFPKIIGRGRWADDRTYVITVRLEPDHEYWLSINNDTFKNFTNPAGESAVPYPIAFKTGAGNPASKPSPKELNRQSIEELKRAIDEDYSYRDLHKLDWDTLFKAAAAKMEAAATPRLFAQEVAKLLARNKDLHVWVKVDGEHVPCFQQRAQPNFGRSRMRLVPDFTVDGGNVVATGKFPDGIGYILIDGWPGDKPESINAAFEALATCDGKKGLIVDVRSNGGGDEPLAEQFAGCFIDSPKVYGKDVIRRGGKFSPVLERTMEPNKDRPKYRGKVAVLTGPVVMSSCESFLLMMKQAPNCKLIGGKSRGSSGRPQAVELSNGVVVYLPSWKDLRMDGTCFEGEGIAPDIEVKAPPGVFEQTDPVLAAALKWLREGTSSTKPAK